MLAVLFSFLLMFQPVHGMTAESGEYVSVRDRIAAITKREKVTTSFPAGKNVLVVPAKTQEPATSSSDTKRPTVQEKPVKKGLFDAAETGELVQVINALKEHDEKTINEKNEKGWPIIAWAIYQGCRIDVILELINAGADVDAAVDDETGSTALHCAVGPGFTEKVKILINDGNADVTKKDKKGRTPAEFGAAAAVTQFSCETDEAWKSRRADIDEIEQMLAAAAAKRASKKRVQLADAEKT